MTADEAIAALKARAIPGKADDARAYHKADRPYLGTTVPEIDTLAKGWRAALSLEDRLTLAQDLWASNIHEARVAAAKLLTQARIRPSDDAAWALLQTWVPEFDAWAIADHAASAIARRLTANPGRLDALDPWTIHANMWTRRAVLVATLPFARLNHPTEAEQAARERALGWAATFTADRDWFIQKAVASWIRDLSKHDAPRAAFFLAEHGPYLRSFARKEAAQYLPV